MANKSVLELAVGTGQWDAGLKKAKQALDNFTSAQGGLQQALEKDNGDMAAFIKMMGNVDSTSKTAKQQLREISNVLTDFTATYRQLTDEQKSSPFGQELAKSIQTLTDRAGVLRDAMDDVQQSIRVSASDTRAFDQIAQGMSVATAGFQGLTGAGKLLGIEIGNDVEVIAKLQAAMAVTNSLTTIQTALQKESALMQGLNAAKAAASAAAHALLSKELSAAAIAQGALNIAMKAAPWMIAIGGVAALCDVLGIFSSDTESATDSQKAFNNEIEEGTNHMKGYADELDKVYDSLIRYRQGIGQNTDYIELEKARVKAEELSKMYDDMYKKRAGRSWEEAKTNGESYSSWITTNYYNEDLQKAVELRDAAKEDVHKIQERIENSDKTLRYFLSSWSKLKTKPEIQKAISAISTFRDQFDIDSSAYARYDDIVNKLQAKISSKRNVTGGGSGSSIVTQKELTETQQLQKNIEALTKEYQQLSDVEKVADVKTATGVEMRKAAIRGEIQTNQKRIEELKKFADEAQGKNIEVRVDIVPVNGSSFTQESISKYVQELQNQLSTLDMSMGGSSAMANDLYANIVDAQTFGNLLKTSIQHGIDLAAVGIDTTSLWEQITNGDGLEDADWKGFVEKINEQLKKQGIKLNIDPQTGNINTDKKEKNTTSKALEKFNGDFSKLTGGVSGIVSGIQSMGVEIPKEIQSVLGVLTGISSIMSGIASILTVIEAATTIEAANPFAHGGVIHAAGGWSGFVPGNSFSGDNVPALLNSGELVLNRFQQQALAGTLENGGMKNITISGALRGEDIVLSADRWGKRTGKGELLFAKNL